MNIINSKFQNAANRIPQNIPPIWMMRQAGRYHSHYQNLRKQYSFMQLCKEPELAAEVAFGPVNEFDFDAAILFSDLLFPLEALGMGLSYPKSGPVLEWQLNESTISKLRPWKDAIEGIRFQKTAMEATRSRIPAHKSLMGFVGGPWTLFGYATEGSHQGGLNLSKTKMQLFRQFSKIIVPLLAENIRLQLEGGAEWVLVIDTSLGVLPQDTIENEVLTGLRELIAAHPKRLGYYAKGVDSNFYRDSLSKLDFLGLGFDYRHRFDRELAFAQYPGFVQGNFDPAWLKLPTADFKELLDRYLRQLHRLDSNQRRGWVCGLGHGVLPETPERHVHEFIQKTREIFSK